MSTWRELVSLEMNSRDEAWDDVIYCTLTDRELGLEFYAGYGLSEGPPFTLWTAKRVYFPVVYDGKEWCESVPRDPCGEVTRHIGGQ
jgi:hypothetical protein